MRNYDMVSLVIPVHNEAEEVGGCLRSVFQVMDGLKVPYEAIVIDDGSIDGTIGAVEAVRNLGPLRILKNDKNEGKASAVLRGVNEAKGEIIVTLDGDGQHLPTEIPLFIKPILEGRTEAVLGSRFLNAKNRIPFRHLLANKVIRRFFNLLYGTHFTDVLLGFRAFRRGVLMDAQLKMKGYLFEVELLKELTRVSTEVEEVGVTCLYPQKSPIPRGIYLTAMILIGILFLRISSIGKQV